MTTAHELDLLGCNFCGAANEPDAKDCRRCHHKLTPISYKSLEITWAWLITSLMLYIPANTYPMMFNTYFGTPHGHTIAQGVILFYDSGDYFVATVIMVASLLIPSLKLVAISYIALSVRFHWSSSKESRVLMYEAIEFIGRWSMIDVFVVTLMVALVQFGTLVTVEPGPAAICFAISVIFAMFAANAFDTKLLWLDVEKGKVV